MVSKQLKLMGTLTTTDTMSRERSLKMLLNIELYTLRIFLQINVFLLSFVKKTKSFGSSDQDFNVSFRSVIWSEAEFDRM